MERQGHGFDDCSDEVIVRILSFLCTADLLRSKALNTRFQLLIQSVPALLEHIDLASFPPSLSSFFIVKLLSQHRVYSLKFAAITTVTLARYLSIVTKTLVRLEVPNSSIELTKALYRLTLPTLRCLNIRGYSRPISDKDIEAIAAALPGLEELDFTGITHLSNEVLSMAIGFWPNLRVLKVRGCLDLDNSLFAAIERHTRHLEVLEVGGTAACFNMKISLNGIQSLCATRSPLKAITFDYCTKAGNKVIDAVCRTFGQTLEELHILRNYTEKTALISEEGTEAFRYAPHIKRLTIEHTGSFADGLATQLATYLKELRELSLAECLVRCSLEPLALGCPRLVIVDLSGDSWVTGIALRGLACHPALQILYLGHFEHSGAECDKVVRNEYPSKGLFIENLFKRENGFPALKLLYLEESCTLSGWLRTRLKFCRRALRIEFRPESQVKVPS